MLISTRCLRGFMSNLIKKSWKGHTVSNRSRFGNLFESFAYPPTICYWHGTRKYRRLPEKRPKKRSLRKHNKKFVVCTNMWHIDNELSWLFFNRLSPTRYIKVKRMGIAEILRGIWLFSAKMIKNSESVSKQPTQLFRYGKHSKLK